MDWECNPFKKDFTDARCEGIQLRRLVNYYHRAPVLPRTWPITSHLSIDDKLGDAVVVFRDFHGLRTEIVDQRRDEREIKVEQRLQSKLTSKRQKDTFLHDGFRKYVDCVHLSRKHVSEGRDAYCKHYAEEDGHHSIHVILTLAWYALRASVAVILPLCSCSISCDSGSFTIS